jgi:hypothetical protein
VAFEQHAFGRESIEVRGTHHRMTNRGQTVAAPLVGRYQEHVAPPVCH